MQDFTKLEVWKKADNLAVAIYRETENFPDSEKYGLTSQLRRAAVSIPTNIAEGCGYSSNAQFCKFLYIAHGSANEVAYLLHLSVRTEVANGQRASQMQEGVSEIKKMLISLIQKVENKI